MPAAGLGKVPPIRWKRRRTDYQGSPFLVLLVRGCTPAQHHSPAVAEPGDSAIRTICNQDESEQPRGEDLSNVRDSIPHRHPFRNVLLHYHDELRGRLLFSGWTSPGYLVPAGHRDWAGDRQWA